jgi:hypothetical protein
MIEDTVAASKCNICGGSLNVIGVRKNKRWYVIENNTYAYCAKHGLINMEM